MQSDYLKKLLASNALREATLVSAIEALNLPKASQGLDVGCGAGLQCLLLARHIGAGGHVTGLDVSAAFLEHGKTLVEGAGLADRISFEQGSAEAIPFDDDTFDWVWSSDCVGYGPWEPMPLLKELKRVTRPGGKVAILAWSSETLLPGYPMLEARLRATSAGIAPFKEDMAPSTHFLRALGWMRDLGLDAPRAQVFSGSAHAPLSDDLYTALKELFEMRWPDVTKELSEQDRTAFERLCDPKSSEFILDHPDYCAFFTYSMFYGAVREG
ncbi:MAG: class I SAM-dependent methyltransferase [Myxococcota bacterium]|nr:class I SAM-dependent methyltransferase [Myxococcota bacterium]